MTSLPIPCGAITLEARYAPPSAPTPWGAVACHPHPLYGGTMENLVVRTVTDAFEGAGVATLRFNFRGVGESGGRYGEGVGELDDLACACEFMRGRGHTRLFIAGYSFGAWVVARARGCEPAGVVLVSAPLDFLDFSKTPPPRAPLLATLGDSDTFASPASLRAWLAGAQKARYAILSRCDHFYGGRRERLRELVSQFARGVMGPENEAPPGGGEPPGGA